MEIPINRVVLETINAALMTESMTRDPDAA